MSPTLDEINHNLLKVGPQHQNFLVSHSNMKSGLGPMHQTGSPMRAEVMTLLQSWIDLFPSPSRMGIVTTFENYIAIFICKKDLEHLHPFGRTASLQCCTALEQRLVVINTCAK